MPVAYKEFVLDKGSQFPLFGHQHGSAKRPLNQRLHLESIQLLRESDDTKTCMVAIGGDGVLAQMAIEYITKLLKHGGFVRAEADRECPGIPYNIREIIDEESDVAKPLYHMITIENAPPHIVISLATALAHSAGSTPAAITCGQAQQIIAKEIQLAPGLAAFTANGRPGYLSGIIDQITPDNHGREL